MQRVRMLKKDEVDLKSNERKLFRKTYNLLDPCKFSESSLVMLVRLL